MVNIPSLIELAGAGLVRPVHPPLERIGRLDGVRLPGGSFK